MWQFDWGMFWAVLAVVTIRGGVRLAWRVFDS
jgi:hypothetical protein